jgi:hypothetical protein
MAGKGADLIVGREYKFNALTGHDDEAGSHHRVDARGAARRSRPSVQSDTAVFVGAR